VSEEAKQRQAEELLQKALSVYGECEPPSDLEEGIIRQVRAAGSKRSPAWLPVLAAAAAILIGVVLIQDWSDVQTPETTVAQLPAPLARPAPAYVAPSRQVTGMGRPPIQKRPIARKASAVKPPVLTGESEISPLPQSELAFSDIVTTPIEIEDLGKETTPLISDLAGAENREAPAAEGLIAGFEEGRE